MKKFWQRLVLFGLTGAFFVSCISCSAANTASKVPILMYHNLTNDPSAVTSMTITGERVQEDMEYLEYNMTVSTQIFIAEAACDLEITLHTGNHQDLFKNLR